MTETLIDLEEYRTPGVSVFSGRPRGVKVRQHVKLAELDKKESIHIRISAPEDVYTITSSFLLGMLGPSVRRFGRDAFLNRFAFVGPFNQKVIEDVIREALNRNSPLG